MIDIRHVLRGALMLAAVTLAMEFPSIPGNTHPALVVPVFLVLLGVLTLHRRKGLPLDAATQILGLVPLSYGTLLLVGQTMGLAPTPLGLGMEAVRSMPQWLVMTAVALDYVVVPIPAALVGGFAVACLLRQWRPLATMVLFLPLVALSVPGQWGAQSLAIGLIKILGLLGPLLAGAAAGWFMGLVVDRVVASGPHRVAAGTGAASGG